MSSGPAAASPAPAVALSGSATRRVPWGLAVPALVTAALVNLPLVYIAVRAVSGGMGEFLAVVATRSTAVLLLRTLALVLGVVCLAVAIAVPSAWLVTRTDLPGRRIWAALGALPLVFPSYVAAFALVAVLGPRGVVQGWLEPFGVERLPDVIYGYGGALLALALFNYPYVFLLVIARLRRLDPALEETSRSLGVGRWRTFRRVVLPAIAPAVSAGSLLVVLYTLSDFGAVSITRYTTFTLSIYTAYRSLFDRTTAASLALVLVVLTLAFVALESRFQRRARPLMVRPTRRARPVPLGRWRWPALVGLGTVTLMTLGIPVGVVIGWGGRGLLAGIDSTPVIAAAGNSLTISAITAIVAVLLAVPIAAWSVRHRGWWSSVVERLAYTGYALPGLVVALAMVFFSIRYARPTYQTAGLLVVAYVVRFLPQAIAACRAALSAVAPAFEEAARGLGRSPANVMRTLIVPLIRPGLLAGWALVFLTVMKELPATLILRPIGFETLATEIWTNASEGFYADASLPSMLLVLVSAVPVYWFVIRPALAERG